MCYFGGYFIHVPPNKAEVTVSASMEQTNPTYCLTYEETFFFLFQMRFYNLKSHIVFHSYSYYTAGPSCHH